MGRNKLLELKKDIVFQKIFGSEENKEITRHLLSVILKRDIKNINLDVNKELIGDITEKRGVLDVRATFNDGEDVDIEIQLKKYDKMPKRLLTYWGQMYNKKLKIGKDYGILKPSIVILIADYKLGKTKGIKKYHTKWNLREEDNPELVLTEDIEIHILELQKVKDIGKDELALWLKFIRNPENMEVQDKMKEKENIYLKQAMEELKDLSNSPGFERLVESREDFLRLHASIEHDREEKGLKRGRKEEKKDIAKKLLEMKIPIDKIIEATGLTEKEINKL